MALQTFQKIQEKVTQAGLKFEDRVKVFTLKAVFLHKHTAMLTSGLSLKIYLGSSCGHIGSCFRVSFSETCTFTWAQQIRFVPAKVLNCKVF